MTPSAGFEDLKVFPFHHGPWLWLYAVTRLHAGHPTMFFSILIGLTDHINSFYFAKVATT